MAAKPPIEPKLTAIGLTRAINALALMDKQVKKQFVKDMRTELRGSMNAVKASVPKVSPFAGGGPLDGMTHAGRTRWSPVRMRLNVNPKPRRKGAGFVGVVGWAMTGSPGGLGFDYAELAGVRRRPPRPVTKPFSRATKNGRTVEYSRVNNAGDTFIRNVRSRSKGRGRAGHFAYAEFLKQKPAIKRRAIKVIKTYSSATTRKMMGN